MPEIERRQWLDEWEERGWTKEISPEGAIMYERPCRSAVERHLISDLGDLYSRPAPMLSVPQPVKPGLWVRLRRFFFHA